MKCDLISEISPHERVCGDAVVERKKSPRRPKAMGRSASVRPSRRDNYDAAGPPATIRPRKKTVAFGSTVPYSQTVEGVLEKKRDQNSDPTPEQRPYYKPILRKPSQNRASAPVPLPSEPVIATNRARQMIAARRAGRESERESDRIQQLQSAMEHMKNDFEERIAHLEAVIETLAETLDTGVGISVAIPVPDSNTPTGTAGIVKYGAPLKQSTPSALFSIANAKDYNRVPSKACQNRAAYATPLSFNKADVKRKENDEFSDLDDSLEENRFMRRRY